ncbi:MULTISPECIES: hypothetical protein [Bacillus]|uniref:hypothetical protein n=1 Tax=Bacillus TaxID=1386 RepID=UPI000E5368FD|nr:MULTISPECIES: hypothetical protein [Bacillus subtilis group]MBT3123271.1 hypothetical protein [Bacillus inaquosorum]MCB4338851.1 hypothetical protein [Bacillus subtilis]MCB5337265.1 hypothetical protein [Bacillus amyloliquefaciens]MCF7615310.1 hypothetical protein [Bacillus subtilis]QTG87174.1 hypothetical protein J4048_21155 [Bacillus amyloliquefaciens]
MKQDIVRKYREFSDYLNSIDLSQLCSMYSRKELQELKDTLHKIDIRSLPYELRTKIDEMKHREYPQLLGVYRYPVINEIDFLSDQEKTDLDKHLGRLRVNDPVLGLWRAIRVQEMQTKALDWLADRGVLTRVYEVLCPDCLGEPVSRRLSADEKLKLEKEFTEYKKSGTDKDYHKLQKIINLNCRECEEEEDELNFLHVENLEFKIEYRLRIERDKSLDYV